MNAWEKFKVRALQMAQREFSEPEAQEFLRELLGLKEEESPRGFARILDLFKGAQLGADKKSLAIEVTLQPTDHTLTDDEIDAVAKKIVAEVTRATGGTLRA